MNFLKGILVIGGLLSHFVLSAQGFDTDNVKFRTFVKRMYDVQPFDGVKIVRDYGNEYVVIAVKMRGIDNEPNTTNFRVSKVRASSMLNSFLNGSTIEFSAVVPVSDELLSENPDLLIESIKEKSRGFTPGILELTNFQDGPGNWVFIYYWTVPAGDG